MPILDQDTYRAKGLFKSGHFNTMYPYAFRNISFPNYQRERIATPDDDFFEVDILRQGNKRCLFLFHGLEGSTKSQYMKGTAGLFAENNFDVIAMNYRGCSGVPNKKMAAYNSGFTQDVELLIQQYKENYDEISLIGYSLGGNLILKYIGDQHYAMSPKIKAAMAVSTPIDLHGCSLEIGKRKNFLYEKNFLKSLIQKTVEKEKLFPGSIDIDKVKTLKKLYDFDDIVTGPMHGYQDAADYYKQCNSLQHISTIEIPALLLTAQDDPFLNQSCYPIDLAKNHPYFSLLMTKYGGHCGFYTKGKSYYWNEIALLEFSQKHSTL